MAEEQIDATWMWHPNFVESDEETAGRFVHFRKEVFFESKKEIPHSLRVTITADTRYKLYVNHQIVGFGPVKGDANLWFYDEVDIATYLRVGRNHVRVHVLRYFFATPYATSFPRLPSGGLRIQPTDSTDTIQRQLQSSSSWETAIDFSVKLRIDEPEDDFLHIYEHQEATRPDLQWIPAKVLKYQSSTGQSTPWNLSPRMIPLQRTQQAAFSCLHNLKSCLTREAWSATLLRATGSGESPEASFAVPLVLPALSKHQVDLEVNHHMNAFLAMHLKRLEGSGATITLAYAESYESPPTFVPYLRNKSHRRDTSKDIYGPRDIYELGARGNGSDLEDGNCGKEIIRPFHFRTFRFIRLQIDVGDSDLVLEKIILQETNYPLEIHANVATQSDSEVKLLWDTSVRTLKNCMHDCYEDCPFYEQLQYAMDMRSSVLFTYYTSGDDRLARQAIIQLRNSFVPRLGLTASRSPSHRQQIIPPFSLYWISTVCDHWLFNGDRGFTLQFLPTIDAILNYFESHLDPTRNLVKCHDRPGIWNFHDWTEEWRPYGLPPSVTSSGISTYINSLYAYTLRNAAFLLQSIDRCGLGAEYSKRADIITSAIRQHCFDGQHFTDSLADAAGSGDKSQNGQAWAVLCGAAEGDLAVRILRDSLSDRARFIPTSISMSFYMLRALAVANRDVYNEHFHRFWDPWRSQLALGLTTWEEDHVSQRSDCHAWGSAPIYEFAAEVAGIKPAEPGWAAFHLEPRLELFLDFKATIPLPLSDGCAKESVLVAWAPMENGDVEVLLYLRTPNREISVYVKLPSLPVQIVRSGPEHRFVVPKETLVNVFSCSEP